MQQNRAISHGRGALDYYIPNCCFFAQNFLATSCKALLAKELRAAASVPKNCLFGSGFAGLGTDAPYRHAATEAIWLLGERPQPPSPSNLRPAPSGTTEDGSDGEGERG